MNNQQIVGALPKPMRAANSGHCDRCGIEIKVRSKGPLHLCVPCRSDREYVRAVTKGEPCLSSM
jgi:hypothetical protein